jgi:hypothetical protein
MNVEPKAMWLAKTPQGTMFLRVYGYRQAVDVALKTWWKYYHASGEIEEEFPVWFSKVVVSME